MKTPAAINQNTVESFRAFLIQSAAANARRAALARRALPFTVAAGVALYAATLGSAEDVRTYAGALVGALVGIPAGVALGAQSCARSSLRTVSEIDARAAAHRAELARI